MINVLLVDDHELIREGLRRAFERDGAFSVMGEADSIATTLQVVARSAPDVVILDVRLPDGSGLDAARVLREQHPTMGIVILTMYAGDGQLFAALEAGASAFLNKDVPADQVLAAARHAASAPKTFSAADLAGAMSRRAKATSISLTQREGEVLAILADGLSIADLAKRLYISESTAKTHISRLYEKLGAANRAQALMTAVRLGLIQGHLAP